jgi:hypothetical protein
VAATVLPIEDSSIAARNGSKGAETQRFIAVIRSGSRNGFLRMARVPARSGSAWMLQ